MTAGPVTRGAGLVGLLALIPTAVLLLLGALTPLDAALRAAVTFVAVLAAARVIRWVLAGAANTVEQSADPPPPGEQPAGAGDARSTT